MGKNLGKKEELNIGVMIFCIVGVVLTILGVLLIKNNNFKMNIIGVEGTVVGVQTSTNANGEIERVVVNLTYNANKSDYTASLNVNKSDLQIGDKMNLYHDLFEPSSVSLKRSGHEGYIALIIGLILTLKTGPRFYRILRDNYL